jgi:hypothetical protein
LMAWSNTVIDDLFPVTSNMLHISVIKQSPLGLRV